MIDAIKELLTDLRHACRRIDEAAGYAWECRSMLADLVHYASEAAKPKPVADQVLTQQVCDGCGIVVRTVTPCTAVKIGWQIGNLENTRIFIVNGGAQYEPHDVQRCLDRLPQIDRYGRIDLSPKETP